MRNRSRFIPALALALTLLVTALLVTPVFAQDETPTEVPTETAGIETEPTPEAEVPPTEEAVGEVPVPEETPVETPAAALADAGLTLVDGGGEPLVMASEEAAGALAAGEVWIKIGTTTHVFNNIQEAVDYIQINNVVPSDGTIHVDGAATFTDQVVLIDGSVNASLNKIKALIGGVSTTTFQPNVTLTGTSNITIQNMTYGTGFLLSGFNIQPTIGSGIEVWNSSGPLRMTDLVVTGSPSTALYINNHNGTISMERVSVSDNSGTGTQIDNYDTSYVYQTGAITINNSSFDRNGGSYEYGSLAINTGGSVTLQGITVSNNDFGLHILQASKITIKNSVINENVCVGSDTAGVWIAGQLDSDPVYGDVFFDNVVVNDNIYGLNIHSYGSIIANKLVINSNERTGAIFDTCGEDSSDCYPYTGGKVTITNSNFDDNSGAEMLRIWSRGAVVLTNVSASGNTAGAGAQVHTHNSLLVSPVTITGGAFNENTTYGLEVLSKGIITLSKVKASGNLGGYGAKLANDYDGATAGVVIKGALAGDNAFDENGVNTATNNDGLYIRTNGAVTLGYLSASRNRGMGLNLEKTVGGVGALTITKGSFDDNGLQGILAISKGAIKLTTVSASDNMNTGADLRNTISTAAPGVTITGGDFNHNQGTGLYVRSKGAIALKTTNAVDNSVRSMAFPTSVVHTVHDVFNLDGTPDLWTVEVDAGMVGINYNVVLTSTTACAFSYIGPGTGDSEDCAYIGNGLYEAQLFPVTFDAEGTWTFTLNQQGEQFEQVTYSFSTDIFDMTGDNWYGFIGADLDNNTPGSTAAVTVSGAAFPKYEWGADIPLRDFTGNSGIGLLINSRGTITVNNVLSYKNGAKGVVLDNTYAEGTATPGVNFSAGRFVYNGDTGLEVHTKGTITAKNIGAYENLALFDAAMGYGTWLESTTAGKAVSVINIKPTVENYVPGFEENAAGGLEIRSKGAVTLTNVQSYGNDNGHGISILTTGSTGNITLSTVTGIYNTNGHGILIENLTGTANVKITDSGASDNTLDGFHINVRGTIVLNKVWSESNQGRGAWLHNETVPTTATPGVTITNIPLTSNVFYLGFTDNDKGGLEINSKGLVTLTNVIASWNSGSGAVIANNNGTSDVRINSSYFDSNIDDGAGGGYGLQVSSLGSIILNKGGASGNFLRGAHLDNDLGGDSPIKAVTITNFVFDNNGATGVGITSNGVVTLTNVGASGNTYYGAYIRNGASNVFVKSSGSGSNTFSDNGYSGLDIRTSGTISLAKVNAVGNTGGYGAQIGETDARTSNVTVLSSTFDQNLFTGLRIYSMGTVTLNGVSAFDNSSTGVYIQNETAGTPMNVIVSKSSFVENTQGLVVWSKGMVTLNGITSLGNGIGADINNTYGTAGVSVLSTLGANTFNGNSSRGLYIRSNGNIILSNVTANGNANNGIEIDNNQSGSGTGYVTLTKVTTWSNNYRGISIVTNNYVTIDGVSSVMNGTVGQTYAGVFVLTNGHNLTIKNSLISSNVAYGVYADLGSGLFSILNTFYFGNNTSDLGYPNIYLVP